MLATRGARLPAHNACCLISDDCTTVVLQKPASACNWIWSRIAVTGGLMQVCSPKVMVSWAGPGSPAADQRGACCLWPELCSICTCICGVYYSALCHRQRRTSGECQQLLMLVAACHASEAWSPQGPTGAAPQGPIGLLLRPRALRRCSPGPYRCCAPGPYRVVAAPQGPKTLRPRALRRCSPGPYRCCAPGPFRSYR